MKQCFAIERECLRIDVGTLLEIAAPGGIELQAELAGYLTRDLILDGEDVAGLHIEALRPEGLAGCGSEQLHADADAVSGLLKAAGQNDLGIEMAGGFERIAI